MLKIVNFEKYCKFCKYMDTKEHEDPCNSCLENPVNDDSHKPICFKEDASARKNQKLSEKIQKLLQ